MELKTVDDIVKEFNRLNEELEKNKSDLEEFKKSITPDNTDENKSDDNKSDDNKSDEEPTDEEISEIEKILNSN